MKKKTLFGNAILFVMVFLLVSSVATVNAFTTSNDDSTTTETETEPPHEEDDDSHEIEESRDENGTAWIQTDIVTVMLNSELPSYQYWFTPDENGSLARFMINFMMIVEFEDHNDDGVFQPNETLNFAPLDAFEWILKTGAITKEDGSTKEVYASYTKGGLSYDWEDDWFEEWMPEWEEEYPPEEPPIEVPPHLLSTGGDFENHTFAHFAELTLQFYGHIYSEDRNGTVATEAGVHAEYTVEGGSELKVDVEIGSFPFTSETSKVAILNYLREDVASSEDVNHYFTLHEESGEDDHESEVEMEDLGEEFEDVLDNDVQEISFVDESSSETQGFYRWVDKALVNLEGVKEPVDVQASYWTDGEGLLLFLAYPNFNGWTLIHDPSVRLIESASPYVPPTPIDLPVMTVAVGSSVIILAAIGLTLKRR
ncbi:MAG: hypothetical protein ACXAAO_08210 [Candidatus Thorarchaeota archaeon]